MTSMITVGIDFFKFGFKFGIYKFGLKLFIILRTNNPKYGFCIIRNFWSFKTHVIKTVASMPSANGLSNQVIPSFLTSCS